MRGIIDNMQLRYYQNDAVEAVWAALKRSAHPVVELPTASGKSLVIAEICHRVVSRGGRALVLTHVQELVDQNAKEFQNLSGIEPGILCAGLERTDKGHDVLFASVQSLYGPAKRGEIPPFDVILIDECHLVSEVDSDAKFYPAAFAAFPDALRVGLSATPFRMDGPVYGEGKYFTEKCYEVSTLELVREGFLSPLVGVAAAVTLDLGKLKTIAGDYDQRSVETQETEQWLRAVALSVKDKAARRKHIAVFCPTVKVAEDAARVFTEEGLSAKFVVGDTEGRDELLEEWKSGAFPVMTSVNILSTGFNFPALDCIVCLRPTQSLSLWIQLLGRGLRLFEGKKNCLLLDYSGNLEIHGGICAGMEEAFKEGKDEIVLEMSPEPKPKKAPGRKVKTGKELTDLDPMLASSKGVEVEVTSVSYVVIRSKTIANKKLLMVNYEGDMIPSGIPISASQFVCNEYEGYAYNEAVRWFERRGEAAVPYSADAARIKAFGLPTPRRIKVRKAGKYINVLEEYFD